MSETVEYGLEEAGLRGYFLGDLALSVGVVGWWRSERKERCCRVGVL